MTPGRTWVIAEIGSNHGQDLGRARELIAAAADAGADAVKFQSLRYDAVVHGDDPEQRALFAHIRLAEGWYGALAEASRAHGLAFSSAPTYTRAVDLLVEAGATWLKLASPQTLAYPQLVDRAARTGLPLVVSTGYCTLEQIARAVGICRSAGNPPAALLHCVSAYPAPPAAVNLRVMDALATHGVPVGLSDHTLGTAVSLAAVARGAAVLERHLTLDRSSPGPDHHFALEPDELARLVREVREVEAALGDGRKVLHPDELGRLEALTYRAVATRELPVGAWLTDGVDYKRAPHGLSAEEAWGRRLRLVRPVAAGAVVHAGDVQDTPWHPNDRLDLQLLSETED